MSSMETGFCTLQEYTAGEPNRLLETDLAIDGLYLALFRLRNSNTPAAKLPAVVEDIEEGEHGLVRVKTTILSPSADFSTEVDFLDGFMKNLEKRLTIGKIPVMAAYFREEYGVSSWDRDCLEEVGLPDQITLPSREPALV